MFSYFANTFIISAQSMLGLVEDFFKLNPIGLILILVLLVISIYAFTKTSDKSDDL